MTSVIEIPGYQLIRPIGKGGMATVYLAIQESFQREVALKIMAPSLSDNSGFSERFLHEARVVSRLIHPHIVTVYDVGIHQGHHYLSMEYVPGKELKACLAELSGDTILRVMREIASALDYASQKGCVHRDVKPENILLHEESGRAVLMDFGIAKADDIGSGMTQTGMALGTPYYMSPEQARGQKVDGRADLYSLGIVFYKMLTGQVPYTGDSAVTIGIKHISEPLPKLPAKLSAFQPLLAKLLDKDPVKRYQRGRDVIVDLDKLSGAVIDKTRQQCFAEQLDSLASRADRAVKDDDNTLLSVQVGLDEKVGTPRRGAWWAIGLTTMSLLAAAAYYQSFGWSFPSTEEQLERFKQRLGLEQKPVLTLEGLLAQSASTVEREQTLPAAAVAVDDDGNHLADVVAGNQIASAAEQVLMPAVDESSAKLIAPALLPATESVNALNSEAEKIIVNTQTNIESIKTEVDAQRDHSVTVFEGLQANTAVIEQRYLSGELTRAELVFHFRALLAERADYGPALQRLNQLENDQLETIDVALFELDSTAIDTVALERIKVLLDNALVDFPALIDNRRYQRFINKYQGLKQLSQQLSAADRFFKQGQLVAPPGDNALGLFAQVLSKEPANKAALQGLAAIADYYYGVATKANQSQRYQQAMDSVNNGLKALPQHAQLLALKNQLLATISRQQQVANLIAQAKTLEAQQQWFGGQSAAERLLSVLAIDRNNVDAQQSLERLVSTLLVQVDEQVLMNTLETAQQLLSQALLMLPNDQRLLAKQEAIDAMQPAIDQLVFSGELFSDLSIALPEQFKAGRVLYIGFNYKNFVNKTTVLQAMLYDGLQTVEIAAVPVIVSGYEGQKFFKINRPVEGFKAGAYRLDILLEGNRVASQSFVVLP